MSERARDRGLNRPATPRPGNSQHPSLRIVTSQVRWYAVSRRCRQSHMNARSYTRMHKHTQTHARGKTAKYQCTASGPRHAAESNRERRHTHTHTKLTHKRTHTHTQPLSQLHSTTLRHSDTTIVFLGALSKSQRSEKERRMRAEEKEGGKKGRKSRAESEDAEVIKRRIFYSFAKVVVLVLLSIKSAPDIRRRRRTDTFDSQRFWEKGHLSDLDPYGRKRGAAQGMDILQKKKRKEQRQVFFFFVVLFGREAASELLEFCWVAAVSEEKRRRPRTQKNLGKRQKASRRS